MKTVGKTVGMQAVRGLVTGVMVGLAGLTAPAAELAHYGLYVETDGDGSSAGEYVLLDYTPKSNSVVKADVAFLDVKKSCFLFCARGTAGNDRTFTLVNIAGSGLRWDYKDVDNLAFAPVASRARHLLEAKNTGLYVDGENRNPKTPADFTPANRMVLFAGYSGPTSSVPNPTLNFAAVRLYSFKAYDVEDGELKLKVDLRPCMDTDGKAALYDEVAQKLYHATSTSPSKQMTVGLPPAQYGAYAVTDGDGGAGGEYVLLDYTPKCDSVVQADVAFLDVTKGGFLFCARGNGSNDRSFALINLPPVGLGWSYYAAEDKYYNIASGERHLLEAKNSGLYVDGENRIPKTHRDFTPANRMALFAGYSAAAGSAILTPNISFAAVRLYSFKAYDVEGGELKLKLDLRPAIDAAGREMLYDEVGEESYYAVSTSSGHAMTVYVETSGNLEVEGSPQRFGEPTPSYGVSDQAVGQECVAKMDVISATNYLMGTERRLLGWELTVSNRTSGAVSVTESAEGNLDTCRFTPGADDQVSLRWLWGGETALALAAGPLPSGYEALDALAFDGRSFVNTKLALATDDQIVDVLENPQPDKAFCVFCARDYLDSATPACALFGVTPWVNGLWTWRYDYGALGSGTSQHSFSSKLGERMTFAVNKGILYLNEAAQANCVVIPFTPVPGPLVLQASYTEFDAQRNEPLSLGNFLRSSIAAAYVWNASGTPKAMLLPCRRTADGVEGLYDVVRQVFCPRLSQPHLTVTGVPLGLPDGKIAYGETLLNAGPVERLADAEIKIAPSSEMKYRVAGWKLTVTDADGVTTVTENGADNVTRCAFTASYGDVISLEWKFDVNFLGKANAHIPSRYSEVEWIRFDGSTFVLTDYTPAPDKVKSRVECQVGDGSTPQAVFCSRANYSTGCYTLFFIPAEGGMTFRYSDAKACIAPSDGLVGVRTKFETDRNLARMRGGEWTAVGDYSAAFTQSGGPVMFGAAYVQPETIDERVEYFGTFKFHSAKFWEGGVLVRWFVPCHDKLENVSGLYDVVTRRFYGCLRVSGVAREGVRLEEGAHVGAGFVFVIK